jgi:hypothetical protein
MSETEDQSRKRLREEESEADHADEKAKEAKVVLDEKDGAGEPPPTAGAASRPNGITTKVCACISPIFTIPPSLLSSSSMAVSIMIFFYIVLHLQ